MRKARVYRNGIFAGTLIEENRSHYVFRYDDGYFMDKDKPAISLTLPKNVQEHTSSYLFPFFFNMLSEGVNRKLQAVQWQIDENDHFGLLLVSAGYDTPGAITVKPVP